MKHIFISLMLAAMCWMAYGQQGINHYAGKEYITYNGVKWKTTYYEDDTAYEIRRAESKYGYAKTRYKDGTRVMQELVLFPEPEPSSSNSREEAAKTFAGKLDKLTGARLYIDYWINTETGRVEDIAFLFDEEYPFTEFDISYFDNLYTRIKSRVRFMTPSPSSSINTFDGFVLMGSNTVLFKDLPRYPTGWIDAAPPAGFDKKMQEIYDYVLDRSEIGRARGDVLVVKLSIDNKTGKVTATDFEINESFRTEYSSSGGFKSARKTKWASMDSFIKNAGFVFTIPRNTNEQLSYTWYHVEDRNRPLIACAALRGVPSAANELANGLSVSTAPPTSPIYKPEGYRVYTLRSSAGKYMIKFIIGSYDFTELAKVRPVIAWDTELGSTGQYGPGSIMGTPVWKLAEIYSVNDFLQHAGSAEVARQWVAEFKKGIFHIIDDRQYIPGLNNYYPYCFKVLEIEVIDIP